MKFSGYLVSTDGQRITIERAEFDETELDPKSDWKETWQNNDPESKLRGFIQLEKALQYVSEALTR